MSGRVSRTERSMEWGVSPCLNCGQHAGVEPKILEVVYEQRKTGETSPQ